MTARVAQRTTPEPARVQVPVAPDAAVTPIERILELARWAPSGDNSQPWRFEVVADDHVVVHAFDTRRHCVYDLRGQASQLSVGAMLETMRIGASAEGRTMTFTRRLDAPEEFPLIDVRFAASATVAADPLLPAVLVRSVQRKPLSTRPLSATEKVALAAAVGPAHEVVWLEGRGALARMAWLAVRSAKIRLTIPEAYAVHRDIIEWDARFSDDRVPDQALGADALSLRSMRWALASWPRVRFMNRWFGGTVLPRLQLDWLPGVRCAAHFAIVGRRPSAGIDDHLADGAAVQRFWLTATALDLQLQPQYTPLVFADYARRGIDFTTVPAARRRAEEIGARLGRLLGEERARRAVFLGRLGAGPAAEARSLRLSVEGLRWIGLDADLPAALPPTVAEPKAGEAASRVEPTGRW